MTSFSFKSGGLALPKSEPKQEPKVEAPPEPTPTPAPATGLGGFNFKPKAATPTPEPAKELAVSSTPLDQTADSKQELQTVGGSPSTLASPEGLMPNEVPAIAIQRDVPIDATPDMLKFIELLDAVPKLFNDADSLGQVIRNIMVSLQNNEVFIQMVQREDHQMITRGMRDVLEGASIKKAAAKKKAGGSRKKKVSTKLDAADLADLDSLMIDFQP